jgi:dolichol-phosphate mannosyltransferase
MIGVLHNVAPPARLRQFIKFCLVGGSGVIVDMTVLHVLAVWLDWNVTISKVCSAEMAMLNNFFWNEVWTFQRPRGEARGYRSVRGRLWRFHAICGAGIGLAVLFLHLFHAWLGFNLYLANLLAIGLVTLWNFSLNATCTWRLKRRDGATKPVGSSS